MQKSSQLLDGHVLDHGRTFPGKPRFRPCRDSVRPQSTRVQGVPAVSLTGFRSILGRGISFSHRALAYLAIGKDLRTYQGVTPEHMGIAGVAPMRCRHANLPQ